MSDPSLLGSLLRVAIVLGLLVGALRLVARRTGKARGRTPAPLFRRGGAPAKLTQVVDRCAVSRTGSVAVVRVADRLLVLGVTDQRIDVLETLDESEAGLDAPADDIEIATDDAPRTPTARAATWLGLLKAVRQPKRPARRATAPSGRRPATGAAAAAPPAVGTARVAPRQGARSTAAAAPAMHVDVTTPPHSGGGTPSPSDGAARLADPRTIELATTMLGRIEVAPAVQGRVERGATAVATKPAFAPDPEITAASFGELRRELLGDAYDDEADDDPDDRWFDDDDPSAFVDDDIIRIEDSAPRRSTTSSPARTPVESPAPWKALVEEIRGRLDD